MFTKQHTFDSCCQIYLFGFPDSVPSGFFDLNPLPITLAHTMADEEDPKEYRWETGYEKTW